MKEDGTKTSEAKEKADFVNPSFGTNFSTQPIANLQPVLPEQSIGEPMYMTIIDIEDILNRLQANKAAGPDTTQTIKRSS